MTFGSRFPALVTLLFGTGLAAPALAQTIAAPPVSTTVASQDSVPLSEVRKIPGVALAVDGSAIGAGASVAGGYRVWTSAFAFGGHIGADAGGLVTQTRGVGFSVGVEKVVDPTLVFGFSVTGTNSRMSSLASTSHARSVLGTLYGSLHRPDGLEVDGAVGFGKAQVRNTHLVDTGAAIVETHGTSHAPLLTASGVVGWRRAIPGGIGTAYWKPFASLSYAGEFLRAYGESDGAGTVLNFQDRGLYRVTGQLGLAIGTEVANDAGWRLHPEIRAAWSDDLARSSLTTTAFAGATPIALRDADPGRSGAILSADVAAWHLNSLELSAGYAVELRRNSVAQLGRVGLRLVW